MAERSAVNRNVVGSSPTPSVALLAEKAPLKVWNEAITQARRSDHKRHQTGCIIWDAYSEEILSKGCSHTHNGGLQVRSIHAEIEATTKWYRSGGSPQATIVTLTKNGNFARSSLPCTNCARCLANRNIKFVQLALRANDGTWQVLSLMPEQLFDYSLKQTKFAGLTA